MYFPANFAIIHLYQSLHKPVPSIYVDTLPLSSNTFRLSDEWPT